MARAAGAAGAPGCRGPRGLADGAVPHDPLRRPFGRRLRGVSQGPHARASASGSAEGTAHSRQEAVSSVSELWIARRMLAQPSVEALAHSVDNPQGDTIGILVLQHVREVTIEDVTEQLLRLWLMERLEGAITQLHAVAKESQRQRQGVINHKPRVHSTTDTVAHNPGTCLFHCGIERLHEGPHRLDVDVPTDGRLLAARPALRRAGRGGPARAPGAASAARIRLGAGSLRLASQASDPALALAALVLAVSDPCEAVVLQEFRHLLDLPLEVVALSTQLSHLSRQGP
mmetsp:Transcript_50731/g.140748  ORF Transcript_50731/g.140748 Transcript_50731/m.140748 type:complete len:287 (+) Transcript_50731:342-1202(+)